MLVPQKSTTELLYYSTIPFLTLYPKKGKISVHIITFIEMIIAVLLTIAKKCKQLKYPPINEWINKMYYPHSGLLFTNKRK